MPNPDSSPSQSAGPLAMIMASLLLAGCGDPPAQQFYIEPAAPDNPMAQTDAAAADLVSRESLPEATAIQAVDGSGTSGALRTTHRGEELVLAIRAEGVPEGEHFASHVHRGVCAEGGPVAALLSPIVREPDGTGTSTTTLAAETIPITEPLFVQIHGPSGAPIACGDMVEP